MFEVDYYNILIIGIDIIRLHMNIISKLVFSIILHLFLLYILLEGEYQSFSLVVFFINPQLDS